ncbi:MAG: hypothetical protein HY827_03015 [Actinobacteria bacterium]|nr:hypothetical protein [Actinomycetota bacterium]
MDSPTTTRYRPGLLLRIRAFLLTDRVGHTLATLLGLVTVFRWFLSSRLRRLADRTRAR